MSETTPTPEPARLPVIFCPVCCTPDDAPSWGRVVMQCPACQTDYIVLLEQPKVAAHSIA